MRSAGIAERPIAVPSMIEPVHAMLCIGQVSPVRSTDPQQRYSRRERRTLIVEPSSSQYTARGVRRPRQVQAAGGETIPVHTELVTLG
jgi:hypothetical protein